MDHVKLQNRIQHCAIRRDIAGLHSIKKDMITEQERLDRWFNKYLHVAGDHLNADNPDTKAWSLYNLKMNEYGKVDDRINTINHYLDKYNNKGSTYERVANDGFSYSV
jgi:hypothetical protein|tara:strand:+ start:3447 stop:3770 length:324 start_codon:yes stop_codon:yes gene_type:complete